MNKHEWDNVFPEVPQIFHETVQRTLDTQVFNQAGGKRVMKKRFPIVLAAVIAILSVTAAAAYVIQWNSKLAEHFNANGQQQSELASAGAVAPVDQTVSKNGLTVTAVQTLGDRNGIYMLFDVKAPAGITLSDTNLFASMNIELEGVGIIHNYSGGFLSDTDSSGSPSGDAKERYFEIRLEHSDAGDWNGKKITISFTDLQADKGKLDMNTVVAGNWDLSWVLSYMDETQTFEINNTYDLNGHSVLVKSIALSPLSLTLSLGGDGLKQLIEDSDFNQCGTLCTLSLLMQDGTVMDPSGSGNESGLDTSYTRTILFDKVLDVDQVTGFTLTFPWEKAHNTLHIALPS